MSDTKPAAPERTQVGLVYHSCGEQGHGPVLIAIEPDPLSWSADESSDYTQGYYVKCCHCGLRTEEAATAEGARNLWKANRIS